MDFYSGPQPACITRPYEHSEEEFEGLLKWMEMEGRRIGNRNEPPHIARALKLFARSELGAQMPMLCPVLGLTEETLGRHGHQVLLAMEELIRVGKIFFPTMDIRGESFETFRRVLDQCVDQKGEVAQYNVWRRDTFLRACLDTVELEQKCLLRDMWVERVGVDKEKVANAFRKVLLYRENLDLGYIFGSLEATGVWPDGSAGDSLFKAAVKLHLDSKAALHGKLQVWNVTVDLEDLDAFKACEILCTIDQLRVHNALEVPQVTTSADTPPLTGDDPWDLNFNSQALSTQPLGDEREEAPVQVPPETSKSCEPVVVLPSQQL